MNLINKNAQIIISDSNGQPMIKQNLSEYLVAPNVSLQAGLYGNSLLDFLTQESFVNKDLKLAYILTGNSHADATRIIGNIAEVLLVTYSKNNSAINKTLAKIARNGERETASLNNYIALATGSNITRDNYNQHYNPNDTQRDLIWVHKDNIDLQLNCKGGNGLSSKPAGLQVKASHDGINYVLPEIKSYVYPIIYFDLNDDWGCVYQRLKDMGYHEPNLIHPDHVSSEIKVTLKGYFNLLVALFRNEITMQRIIDIAKYDCDTVLSAGIAASDLNVSSKIYIPK